MSSSDDGGSIKSIEYDSVCRQAAADMKGASKWIRKISLKRQLFLLSCWQTVPALSQPGLQMQRARQQPALSVQPS